MCTQSKLNQFDYYRKKAVLENSGRDRYKVYNTIIINKKNFKL